jgi:hypothetical protein
MTKSLISYTNNLNFSMTSKAIGSGSLVVLYHTTGVGNGRQQWILDETNQVIRNASDETLVLSIQGSPKTGSFIILSTFIPGNSAQQWDWSSQPGTIISTAYPSFAIDNKSQAAVDNNPIWLYPVNQTGAQTWTVMNLSNNAANAPLLA